MRGGSVWVCAGALLLAACGGGGGGGSTVATTPSTGAGATPTPAATAQSCSLRARQDWAAAQLREWYLFPELLASNVNPASYASVDEYIDALTAPARAERRDRHFTYLTSIREDEAFFAAGESAGFGVRLVLGANGSLFVREAYEGAPALAAGMDRGTWITAIGTSEATARDVSAILADGGGAALEAALGTGAAGETRFFRFRPADSNATRTATVTSATYALPPVSPRYGVQVIDLNQLTMRTEPDGRIVTGVSRPVGYVNLRTFVSTAEAPLRAAFARFRAEGITEVVIDLRYNGGGLVSTAQLLTDLIGGGRSTAEVQGRTTYRREKAASNRVRNFAPQPESVTPMKVAFLTTGASASASEVVINAMVPYLRGNMAMVGDNTFGKPVGQIAIDRPECDDRLRIVAFATQNAAGQGDYYSGLSSKVDVTCGAPDEPDRPFDRTDRMIAAGLSFVVHGRANCSVMAGSTGTISADASPRAAPAEILQARHPNAAQRHIIGLF